MARLRPDKSLTCLFFYNATILGISLAKMIVDPDLVWLSPIAACLVTYALLVAMVVRR